MSAVDKVLFDYSLHLDREQFFKDLSAAGYAVVPQRLTVEMLRAGIEQKNKGNPIPNIWHALLAASEPTR